MTAEAAVPMESTRDQNTAHLSSFSVLLLLAWVVYIGPTWRQWLPANPVVRTQAGGRGWGWGGSGWQRVCLARCHWKSLFQLNASRAEQRGRRHQQPPREQNPGGPHTGPAGSLRAQRPSTHGTNAATTLFLFYLEGTFRDLISRKMKWNSCLLLMLFCQTNL